MYNLIKQCKSGWKMTPFAVKLISNKPCFCHDVFFATGMKVLWKNKKSDALCTLCPDWPVYAVLLSDRWCRYELISSPCSDSPLPTTECLRATPSGGSSSSWDGPVYCTATFPAAVWSQFKWSSSPRKQLQRICFPTSLMLQLTLAC